MWYVIREEILRIKDLNYQNYSILSIKLRLYIVFRSPDILIYLKLKVRQEENIEENDSQQKDICRGNKTDPK